MDKKDVFKQLRVIVDDFWDNECISDNPKNINRYINIDADKKDILSDILYLLLKTNYTCDISKVYLLNKYVTYEGIAQMHNEKNNKSLVLSSVRKAVWRDKEKFIADFGASFIEKLIYDTTFDAEQYRTKLVDTISSSSHIDLLKEVDLDLENKHSIFNDSITDAEFCEFIQLIKPYIKRNKNKIQSELNVNTLAYIEYILNHQSLTDIDKDRLDILHAEING